jgi:hypothetical protein
MLRASINAFGWPAIGVRVLDVAEIRAEHANDGFGAASAR